MKKRYSSDIKQLMKQIRQLCVQNPEATIPLCKRLLRLGQARQDDFLLGFAYYHLDSSYYDLNITDKILKNHPNELHYLTRSGQYKYVIHSHNTFGLIAASQNNIALALDNYLTALELANRHHYEYMKGILYNNIGELYKGLGQFENAIPYFRKAEHYCKQDSSQNYYYSNLILIHAALCFCYYRLGDQETAQSILEYMNETEPMAEDRYHEAATFSVKFCYYHKYGTPGQRDALLPDLLKAMEDCSSFYDFYTYFWEVCSILSETSPDDSLIQVIHILESKLNKEQRRTSPYLILQLLTYKVDYYKKKNNAKHYHNALEEYHRYKEQQLQFSQTFTKSILDFRLRMEKLNQEQISMQEQIELLQHKSQRDPVTGLANYAYLKDRLEQLFETAYQKQESFGVAILDIDYFKQYNDTYGHQAGDEALMAVADTLKSLESDQIFCGRYGGDEFILLFSHMTDSQVLHACEQIRSKLAAKQIPHESNPASPYLSVSQGIQNSVPTRGNKSWDYLHAADMALYDVKGHHRTGIYLINRYTVPENMSKTREVDA